MTTNDLVKRLREETEYWGPLLREAADEIERLQKFMEEPAKWKHQIEKALLDDMRETLPEHPPLRGPIQAWLDAYAKDRGIK